MKTARGLSSRHGQPVILRGLFGVYPIFTWLVCVWRSVRSAIRRREGGGDEETRTPDPLLAKEMLFRLSYVPSLLDESSLMVGVSGLEPETSALSGQCSNQLS